MDWNLAVFYIKDWTRQTIDEDGNIVFLKNVEDKVSISFRLEQLNVNGEIYICDDTNGYDD